MLLDKKRGSLQSTIILWAIIILSLILVFNFVYKFYMKSSEFQGEKECHDAIVLVDTLAKKGPVPYAEYSKPWPATCKTQDRIYYDRNPEDVKKRLAELMSWCWWMMGEGVVKPFDRDWLETSRKCYFCYTVSFPALESDISPPDFGFYLQDTKAKTGQTYYDYFKYSEEKIITTPLADPIRKGGTYSVVYTHPGDTSAISILGYYETIKNDLVYVADITRETGGCIGSWSIGTVTQTGETP